AQRRIEPAHDFTDAVAEIDRQRIVDGDAGLDRGRFTVTEHIDHAEQRTVVEHTNDRGVAARSLTGIAAPARADVNDRHDTATCPTSAARSATMTARAKAVRGTRSSSRASNRDATIDTSEALGVHRSFDRARVRRSIDHASDG